MDLSLVLLFALALTINPTTAEIADDVEEAEIDVEDIEAARRDPIRFYLFTLENPYISQRIRAGDKEALEKSNFNSSWPTRFIIHGYLGNHNDEMNLLMRQAYFSLGNYNVFSISHRFGLSYNRYVRDTPMYGKRTAELIDFLHTEGGMSFETLVLVGHSMGAQVCGYAGKQVTQGRIGQITGLDPAGPQFPDPNKRLNSTDAVYVETIQTNNGTLGIREPVGQAAFYPNGGTRQPSCILVNAFTICDHLTSYRYYAEAIRRNNFPSIRCKDEEELRNNECDTPTDVKMGDVANKEKQVEGIFYVEVNRFPPYGSRD